MTRKRIILASLGSAGDLHPYVAIARGLKARGHSAAVGSHPSMRLQVEGAGVDFVTVRPAIRATRAHVSMTEELTRPVSGYVRVLRELILPNASATFEDLKDAVRGADLLITSPTVPPATLVAAKTGVPWIPACHTLKLFSSLAERMAGNLLPGYGRWRRLCGIACPLASGMLTPATSFEKKCLTELWRSSGLTYNPRLGPEEQFPAKMILWLISPVYATAEWHRGARTRVTGFPLYDGTPAGDVREDALETFLSDGEPPLVFAMGSSNQGRTFFPASLEAALRLKRRALFLIGQHPRSVLPERLPEGMMAATQVPYSRIFPRAEIVVHHGGVGTTALGLMSGRPMLVAPRAFDQPDNAARAERLGVARVIRRSKYNAARAEAELWKLLNDDGYRSRAAQIADLLRPEDGVRGACDAIEEFLC